MAAMTFTRVWSAASEAAFEGSAADELRVRFRSRPPTVWENCHAFIVLGIEDVIFGWRMNDDICDGIQEVVRDER